MRGRFSNTRARDSKTRLVKVLEDTPKRRLELRQQENGNFNYLIVSLSPDRRRIKDWERKIQEYEAVLRDEPEAHAEDRGSWKHERALAMEGLAEEQLPENWTGNFDRAELATVYTKTPDCKRGEYAEEIDVATRWKSDTEAKKIAQAVCDAELENCRPVRVVWRVPGFLFT